MKDLTIFVRQNQSGTGRPQPLKQNREKVSWRNPKRIFLHSPQHKALLLRTKVTLLQIAGCMPKDIILSSARQPSSLSSPANDAPGFCLLQFRDPTTLATPTEATQVLETKVQRKADTLVMCGNEMNTAGGNWLRKSSVRFPRRHLNLDPVHYHEWYAHRKKSDKSAFTFSILQDAFFIPSVTLQGDASHRRHGTSSFFSKLKWFSYSLLR